MFFKNDISAENKMLLTLNKFIHGNSKLSEWHMEHIRLVAKYAILLNKKLNVHLSDKKLTYIAYSHDLFKERSLDPSKPDLVWNGHSISQDNNRYVRLNLKVLEEYGLDEYFNTDVQLHALAAGIFLIKEFGIKDPEILYPVMFHSCPIIDVYKTLSSTVQTYVDIIILADKLSSNYLRINMRGVEVRTDLDLLVFGPNGREFNYTLGLYVARLIGQGKSDEKQSIAATKFYYERLCERNPLICKDCTIKTLGGIRIWPKRKSQVWKTD